MIGRGSKKKKKIREENKKIYEKHRGALEFLEKHSDALKMLGNNLELMKLAAILVDISSPTLVNNVALNKTAGTASVLVGGVFIHLEIESFMSAYGQGLDRMNKDNAENENNS